MNNTNTTPNTPKTTGRRGRPAGSKNKETFEMMPVGLLIKVLQANAMVPVKKEFADMLLANVESQEETDTETYDEPVELVEEDTDEAFPDVVEDAPYVSPLNAAVEKQMAEDNAEDEARKQKELEEEIEFNALLAEEEAALTDTKTETNEVSAAPLGVRHAAKPSVLLMN